MNKVRHVDLHADEFLAAVAGEMSPAELGVYWMICLLCYSRGGQIELDLDWLRAKFRPSKGNRVVGELVERLIAMGRVDRDGNEICVRRVRDELEITLRRIRDASESGRRGGGPRKNINGVEKPSPLSAEKLTTNHQPPTISKEASASLDCPRDGARGEPRKERSYGPNSRKTRIASDWQPDLADCQYAAGRGWDGGRIGEEADAFADRCNRDGPLYADWHAAWRTWVRNADKFAARDTARAGGANGAARPGPITAAMRAVLSRGGMG
jgi:hypothetical protein